MRIDVANTKSKREIALFFYEDGYSLNPRGYNLFGLAQRDIARRRRNMS